MMPIDRIHPASVGVSAQVPAQQADAAAKQSSWPQLVRAVLGYAAAASLPTFAVDWLAKITGQKKLTDRLAERLFSSMEAMTSESLQGMTETIGQQSATFYRQAGVSALATFKSLLANHLKASKAAGENGWQQVDQMVNETVQQMGTLGVICKPLTKLIWRNVKIDLERQLDTDKAANADIATTIRTEISPLIMQLNPIPLIGADNTAKALVESLKTALINTLNAPDVLQTITDSLGYHLKEGASSTLVELIKGAIGDSPPMQHLFDFALQMLSKTASANKANREPAPLNAADTLAMVSRQFLRSYLANNQWHLANQYVESQLVNLPNAYRPVAQQLWTDLKKDIQSYADNTPNQTVTQLTNTIKYLVGGYINQFGWEKIDQYVRLTLQTAMVPGQQHEQSVRAINKLIDYSWQQVKPLLEDSVVDRQADSSRFINNTLNSVGQLISGLLAKPNVAEQIGKLANPNSEGTQQTILQRFTMSLTLQLFGENAPSIFSPAGWIKKGGNVAQHGVVGLIRTYLAGQGFTTLDQYMESRLQSQGAKRLVEQIKSIRENIARLQQFPVDEAEKAQIQQQINVLKQLEAEALRDALILPRNVAPSSYQAAQEKLLIAGWQDIKAQLTTELFGSADALSLPRNQNEQSALSILVDMQLRRTLSLTDSRSKDWLTLSRLVTFAAASMGMSATMATTEVAVEATKAVASAAVGATQTVAGAAASATKAVASTTANATKAAATMTMAGVSAGTQMLMDSLWRGITYLNPWKTQDKKVVKPDSVDAPADANDVQPPQKE